MLHAKASSNDSSLWQQSPDQEAVALSGWNPAWLMQEWLQLSDESVLVVDRQLRIVAHTRKADAGCRKITGFPPLPF